MSRPLPSEPAALLALAATRMRRLAGWTAMHAVIQTPIFLLMAFVMASAQPEDPLNPEPGEALSGVVFGVFSVGDCLALVTCWWIYDRAATGFEQASDLRWARIGLMVALAMPVLHLPVCGMCPPIGLLWIVLGLMSLFASASGWRVLQDEELVAWIDEGGAGGDVGNDVS